MRPKLIAIDLDGTLVNSRGEITERSMLALRAANAAGIVIAPATARSYHFTLRPFQPLGFPVASVCAVGADVRAADGTPVEQWPLDPGFLAFCQELSNRAGWTTTVSTPGAVFRRSNELPPWAAAAPPWIRAVTLLESEHTDGALSVFTEGELDPVDLAELMEWEGRVTVFPARSFNGQFVVTVSPPGIDKGTGLRALCRHLGIDPSEAAAIGDSDVDIPMFRTAGLAVAMGDATEETKAAAHRLTTSADEDGVAEFIESLL